MADDPNQTAETMTCPCCKREATVTITRHPTMSPKHVDLECRCERCGEMWQAAEDAIHD